MMEIELLDAVDAVIVAPVFAGAVGARNDQSMQDGQKDGALDRKLETPSPEKLLDNGLAARVRDKEEAQGEQNVRQGCVV